MKILNLQNYQFSRFLKHKN